MFPVCFVVLMSVFIGVGFREGGGEAKQFLWGPKGKGALAGSILKFHIINDYVTASVVGAILNNIIIFTWWCMYTHTYSVHSYLTANLNYTFTVHWHSIGIANFKLVLPTS